MGAYPVIARQSSYLPRGLEFHACSGALIEDFWAPYNSNTHFTPFLGTPTPAANEAAQLDYLDANTSVVTIGVGGNNVGFPQVMDYCAKRLIIQPLCEQEWGAAVSVAIMNLSTGTAEYKNLPDLYQEIRNRAPHAKVFVVGYPRIFPNSFVPVCGTGVPGFAFDNADMTWINSKTASLNSALDTAATNAGFTFIPVDDALTGHELCTLQPWVHDVDFDFFTSASLASPSPESFHPTDRGQYEIAKKVREKIEQEGIQ